MNQAQYLEEAEAEFLAEISYYKTLQVQGADKFRAAVEDATARALTFPGAGLQYFGNTRRVFLKGYPFFVVYLPAPSGIVVVAVVHEARRPGYWMSRLPGQVT